MEEMKMLDILSSCLSLVTGLASLAWGLISLVCVSVGEVLYHLHVSAPRLEGLLVGIALSWVLLRRDKHPALRVLSAPLKLVLDILDLAWDQCVEVFLDCKGAVLSAWGTLVGWVLTSLGKLYGLIVDKLASIKQLLSKQK
jgi:hypothetical protein